MIREFKPFRLTLPSEQEKSSEELAKQKLLTDYHQMLLDMPATGSGFNENLVKVARWAHLCGLSLSEFDQDVRKHMQGKQVTRAIDSVEIPKAWRTVCSTSGENSVSVIATPMVKKAYEEINKFNINKNFINDVSVKYKDCNELTLKNKSKVEIPSTKTGQSKLLLENMFFEGEYFFIGAKTLTEPMKIGLFKPSNGSRFNYIVANPFTGTAEPKKNTPEEFSKRSDNAISKYRHTILEFDGVPVEDQIRAYNHFIEIGLPVTAIIKSGGKSVHCWLAVNIEDRNEWNAKVETILYKGVFEILGADPTCKNPSRLSRMAGHVRSETGNLQELLYINPSHIKGKSDNCTDVNKTIDVVTNDSLISCNGNSEDKITIDLTSKPELDDVKHRKWWYEKEAPKRGKKVSDGDEINTVLDIDITEFYKWLSECGFGKCYFNGSKSSSLILEKKNVVYPITWEQVSDHTIGYLDKYNGQLDDCVDYHNPIELMNLLRSSRRAIIDEKNLMTIRPITKDFHADTKDYSYCYFLNGFTSTSENGTTFHEYNELPAVIWEESKIQRNFNKCDEKESMFSKFVEKVCSSNEERIIEMQTSIGYMLHRYKRQNYAKAVVCIDEGLKSSEKGGTGKSMLSKAIRQFRNLLELDGENAGVGSNQFAFDGVTMSTDIVYLDDIPIDFNLRKLFSRLSNSFLINRKNKDSITLEYSESPKFMVSTNHAITGLDASYKRRIVEVEFAPHFNKNKTVLDEFGCMFFEDWDSKEWARFDAYMLECLRLFISEGQIVEADKINTMQRQIDVELQHIEVIDFVVKLIEQIEEVDGLGVHKVCCDDMYSDFRNENPDFRKVASSAQLSKYVMKYLEIIGRSEIKKGAYDYVNKNGNYANQNGNRVRKQHVKWEY